MWRLLDPLTFFLQKYKGWNKFLTCFLLLFYVFGLKPSIHYTATLLVRMLSWQSNLQTQIMHHNPIARCKGNKKAGKNTTCCSNFMWVRAYLWVSLPFRYFKWWVKATLRQRTASPYSHQCEWEWRLISTYAILNFDHITPQSQKAKLLKYFKQQNMTCKVSKALISPLPSKIPEIQPLNNFLTWLKIWHM